MEITCEYVSRLGMILFVTNCEPASSNIGRQIKMTKMIFFIHGPQKAHLGGSLLVAFARRRLLFNKARITALIIIIFFVARFT